MNYPSMYCIVYLFLLVMSGLFWFCELYNQCMSVYNKNILKEIDRKTNVGENITSMAEEINV